MFYLFVFTVLTASELRALATAKAKEAIPTSTEVPLTIRGEGSRDAVQSVPITAASHVVTRSITSGPAIREPSAKTNHTTPQGKSSAKRPRILETVSAE